MTPEQIELAKRLAEHREWKWSPGVQVLQRAGAPGQRRWVVERLTLDDVRRLEGSQIRGFMIPDLTDDATTGVLLGRLSSEVGACVQVAQDRAGSWSVDPWGHADTQQAQWWPCLGEALAWALLAVWGSP